MAKQVGYYDPETARMVLAVIRQLKQAGLVENPRRRGRQTLQPETPIYVLNVSGETIPAYACMQATGTDDLDGQCFIEVDQPADSTGEAGWFLFNGPIAIPDGERGVAHDGPLVRALSSATTGSCGPVASSWTVAAQSDGMFTAVGADAITTSISKIFVGGATGGKVVHAYTPGGGIAARSSLTMGSASCDLYDCSSSGVLSDSGTNITVYNFASNAIAGSTHILAELNTAGLYVAIAEDCGA